MAVGAVIAPIADLLSKRRSDMQFPTPRCSFLQSTTPSFWSPLPHKAHPSTSIAYHFDKHLISIPIYLLLLFPAYLQARALSCWPPHRSKLKTYTCPQTGFPSCGRPSP